MSDAQPATPTQAPTVSEVYKEQYTHFRAMNDILYKIPPLFTAVIGGLWYVALQNLPTDRWVSRAVFFFAGFASVCFVQVMRRFGLAFRKYLDNLNELDGKWAVRITGGLSTISVVKILLWCSAILSALGIVYSFR